MTDLVLSMATRGHGRGGDQRDDDVSDDVSIVVCGKHEPGARSDPAVSSSDSDSSSV